MTEQLLHYFVLSGGLLAVMPVLLVLTLAVGFERWWLLSRTLRSGQRVQSTIRRIGYRDIGALRALAREQPASLQASLIATALASQAEAADAIENHLDEVVMRASPLLARRLWILDTSVTIAPLLGLFGTIIGLIQTFNVLSAHGGPAEVTGGIADALIATGAGVLIAIVAVCWLNCLNALLSSITFQIETVKLALINRLHGNGVDMPVDAAAAPSSLMPPHLVTVAGR